MTPSPWRPPPFFLTRDPSHSSSWTHGGAARVARGCRGAPRAGGCGRSWPTRWGEAPRSLCLHRAAISGRRRPPSPEAEPSRAQGARGGPEGVPHPGAVEAPAAGSGLAPGGRAHATAPRARSPPLIFTSNALRVCNALISRHLITGKKGVCGGETLSPVLFSFFSSLPLEELC